MITSQNRKVSVVVPNYNYARYLPGRLKSILGQTYPIYELIVLDDASTDGSAEVILRGLEKYGAKMREVDRNYYEGKIDEIRVKVVINEVNSGKAMAQWKKGWELATGEFIWIAEADDFSSKSFLAEAMKGFDDPQVVLSYSESMIINSWGLVIAPNFRWSRDKEKTGHYNTSYVKDGFQEIEEIMAIRCTIPNVSAVVFRNTKKIPYLEYLDEALKFSQVGDWYFYTRVLRNGKIAYNRRSLNKFRIHRKSKTASAKRDERHFEEIKEMHKYLANKYNIDEFVARRMQVEEERVRVRLEDSKK